MILTQDEIRQLGIVQNVNVAGERASSYDATVGEIVQDGKTIDSDKFVLPPRGMVWVVSGETFKIPKNVTGLATLRTTWTHEGILALNVGVVDPGWSGPLATALVNFSNSNYQFQKGERFLRVLFLQHKETDSAEFSMPRAEYISYILGKSAKTPITFLDLHSLGKEIMELFSNSPLFAGMLTKTGVKIALVALGIGFFFTILPLAYSITGEFFNRKVAIETLKNSIDDINKDKEKLNNTEIKTIRERIELSDRKIFEIESKLEDILKKAENAK